MINQFVIYLAGPMTGCTYEEQCTWRKNILVPLYDEIDNFDIHLKIINPLDYYNFENPSHDTELEVMKFDLRAVLKSDLIIAKVDKSSTGTNMELITAYNNNIPILGYNPGNKEIHPWVRCCLDKEFFDLESLLWYVKEFYLE